MLKKIILFFLSIILITCGLLKIDPVEKLSSYPYLYVGNWGLDEVFVVDLSDNSIIDTLTGFGSVIDLCTSINGKRLYISTGDYSVNGTGEVYSINLLNKERTRIHDQKADIYIRPDDIPIIISYTPYDSIRSIGKLDTITNTIAFYDELDIYRGLRTDFQTVTFDWNEPIMYSITNKMKIFSYNYLNQNITKRFESIFPPFSLQVSGEGKYLYSQSAILDIEADTVVYSYSSKGGSIAVNHAESKLYLPEYGNPWSTLIGPPSSHIYIVDLNSGEISDSICVADASKNGYAHLDRMIISPNDEIAYVGGISEIFVIDLRTNQVIDVIDFGDSDIWIKSIAFGL